MKDAGGDNGLSIGDVSGMTGVSEDTLRAWEKRHGFLAASRVPGRHRRYTQGDVDLIARVAADRERGVPLGEAIRLAVAHDGSGDGALFGPLRRALPGLAAQTMPKHKLINLSHALEDEIYSRAEEGLLAAGFQRTKFFDVARPRWQDLAGGVDLAFALADFPRRRVAGRPPAELPLPRDSPLEREWMLVWDGPGAGACLVARERPGQGRVADHGRIFDAVWSVDPEAVRHVSRAMAAVATLADPAIGERANECLDSFSPPPARSQLSVGAAIAARALARSPG